MVVRKGWEASIVVSAIKAAPNYGIVGDTIIEPGVAATAGDYFIKLYPVVNASGVETVTESDVHVYTGGDTPTVLVGDTDFTLGLGGVLTLTTAGATTVGSNGLYIDYNYRRKCGQARGVSWSVEATQEGAFALGQRAPLDYRAGDIEITGNIDEFFVDRVLFQQSINMINEKMLVFQLIVENTKVPPLIRVTISNIRFNTYNLEMVVDDFIGNNADFTAENINAEVISV